MKRLQFALLVWLLMAAPSTAEHVQTSKVRYAAGYGMSQWYTVDVTFLTGTELNRATRTFDYDGFGKYAVVFWGEGQAAVIKVENFLVCGTTFSQSCLPSLGNLRGEDQDGRRWEVCTQRLCL